MHKSKLKDKMLQWWCCFAKQGYDMIMLWIGQSIAHFIFISSIKIFRFLSLK